MAKARKVEVLTGVGSFLDPHHMEVAGAGGKKTVVKFAKAIIAAGSQAVKLPFMPEDERIVDSTGALLLQAASPSACWWSAAESSDSRWPPSTRRSARASTSSRCSTA